MDEGVYGGNDTAFGGPADDNIYLDDGVGGDSADGGPTSRATSA